MMVFVKNVKRRWTDAIVIDVAADMVTKSLKIDTVMPARVEKGKMWNQIVPGGRMETFLT